MNIEITWQVVDAKRGTPEFEQLLDQYIIEKYGTPHNKGKICVCCFSKHLPASNRTWFDNKYTKRLWECPLCEECYADVFQEETLCASN